MEIEKKAKDFKYFAQIYVGENGILILYHNLHPRDFRKILDTSPSGIVSNISASAKDVNLDGVFGHINTEKYNYFFSYAE